MKKSRLIPVTLAAIALTTVSCRKEKGCTDSAANNYAETAEKDDGTCDYSDIYAADKEALKTTYANIASAMYEDSYLTAQDLQTEIASFVANPTAQGLIDCQTAWLASREPYGQTEVLRFSNGPIDDADGPEGLLNAWPMDESHVDYVAGNATAGIINDATTFPTIDAAVLEAQNENGGEENVSVGYHAIEFLLWGQDDANTALQTPGQRSYLDFVDGGGTATNEDRRRQYLSVLADYLVDNLEELKEEWSSANSGNYRATFLALDNNTALQNVMTGMGTLSKSELAGERMFVALDNQDQEDEHSCFSDNTHRDVVTNAQGIRNIYIGSYTRVDASVVSGASFEDLLLKVNPTLKTEWDALSTSTISTANAIPTPFDYQLTQETTGGNGPIMQTITALQSQGDKIVEAGAAIGITISTAL
jgi:putative iron-regulated protein